MNIPYLTEAEIERLAMLAEEAGEIVQIVGKILRHGYDSRHPDDLSGPDNREMLERELGDLAAVQELMSRDKDVSLLQIDDMRRRKLGRIYNYTHHQE